MENQYKPQGEAKKYSVGELPEPKPTLRDHFAMHALTGLLGHGGLASTRYCRDEHDMYPPIAYYEICGEAYRFADAMIKARKTNAILQTNTKES